ncbi:ADP-ribose pyrophosphatase YjhB (NUDIX family) OS=Streptomyces griseomycini OX=66895 GN=FHS37_006211 PE=4 SV=1 [Streptomyces griseomycini]
MPPCALGAGFRPPGGARRRRYPSRMTTTQDAQDFAAYLASLPRVLAGAAVLLRDGEGRVLLVEPNYREGWALPGGTIESDDGESPREGARRETAEEIGLDREPGRLLAVDWVRGPGRPPLVAYLYDGGVLGEEDLAAIRLQESELLSWRLVPREELTEYLPDSLGRRVLAALDVLADGSGTAELEDGHRVH